MDNRHVSLQINVLIASLH